MLGCVFFYFVFNEPATTVIYPYWHSLSRHDALPIWSSRCRGWCPTTCSSTTWPTAASSRAISSGGPISSIICRNPTSFTTCSAMRSEEHTSELQSLMRTSYAVFCLKTKTYHNKDRQHTHQIISHINK